MQPKDERYDYDFEDAVLVASSRSGVTENVQLKNGSLVEVYHCKSGRVAVSPIPVIDGSLTMLGNEPY